MNTELIITAAALGTGLAMDAFSVSLANGLADRNMNMTRMMVIAGTYAGFQFLMPLIGWLFVHTAESMLVWFSGLVPWIALFLLLYIGGKMLKEGIEENRKRKAGASVTDPLVKISGDADADNGSDGASEDSDSHKAAAQLGAGELVMQGIATSIDALTVGFTIASYSAAQALSSSVIIGVVTLVICLAGLRIGRRLGTVLAGRASIFGGVILIAIGIEIFLKGVLG